MDRRRATLTVIGAGAGLGTAALAGVPVAGLVASSGRPSGGGATGGADREGWFRVAPWEAVRVGVPLLVTVRGDEVDAWAVTADRRLGSVWLVRDGEGAGTLRALSAECPHVGCQIERSPEGFRCPCHVSRFDPQGRALSGAAPRGMDPLDVRVEDGAVWVRFVRFRPGVAAREPQV